MDELLIRVLTRLIRVHDELGPSAFEAAAHRSIVAIAHSVHAEASRRAGLASGDDFGPDVIHFPLPGRSEEKDYGL